MSLKENNIMMMQITNTRNITQFARLIYMHVDINTGMATGLGPIQPVQLQTLAIV